MENIEKSIFKAYDVRGEYPDELNEEAVFEIARGISEYFERKAKSETFRPQHQNEVRCGARQAQGIKRKVKSEKLLWWLATTPD